MPIKIQFNKRAVLQTILTHGKAFAYSCDGYLVLWQSKNAWAERFEEEKCIRFFYPENVARILVHKDLVYAVCAPSRMFYEILDKLYYSKLSNEYEKGLAAGRREVLENLETYKDLTPEEMDALLATPN